MHLSRRPRPQQAKRGAHWLHLFGIFAVFCLCTLVVQLRGGAAFDGSTNEPFFSTRSARRGSTNVSDPAYLTGRRRCRMPLPTEEVAKLDMVGSWEPYRPIEAQQVTITTPINLERLGQLENQCKTWPFPLAVAAYVQQTDAPDWNGTSVAEARKVLDEFHARMRQEGVCNLELRLFTEWCDNETLPLFPNNALRNRALEMVQTEVVFAIDVDLIVGKEFVRELSTPEGWTELNRQLAKTQGLVVPSFTPNLMELRYIGHASEDELEWGKNIAFHATAGKQFLSRLVKKELMVQFGGPLSPHRQTNASRWLVEEDYYSVDYIVRYEPDTITRTQHMPWYDERFRAYGFNKAIMTLAMWHWGVEFAVHPRAYVVHVSHLWPESRRASEKGPHYLKMADLYRRIHASVAANNGTKFYPVTRLASQYCGGLPEDEVVA